MTDFWSVFGAVLIAQTMSNFATWLFKRNIEPRLDKVHDKFHKVIKGEE